MLFENYPASRFKDVEKLETSKHQDDNIRIQKEINAVKIEINQRRKAFYKKNRITRRW